MSTQLQKRLQRDMKKCFIFLYKVCHEGAKDQTSRLNISTNLQRKTLLRIIRQISCGQIPMAKNTYTILVAKKKKSIVIRFSDKKYFKDLIQGPKEAQIAILRKLLSVLNILLKPIFYK